MSPEIQELKSSLMKTWSIQEGSATGSDGATVKMFKTDSKSGAKIVLSFHCQDTMDEEPSVAESLFGAGGNDDDDDEEETELSGPLQFQVTVTRMGKVMRMECTSEDAVASVDGITVLSSGDEDKEKDGELYRGPILDDLPEDVREALDEYLREDCGIDEDVSAFVSMYSDYREQAEYVRWLNDVKKIVQ